MTTPTPSNPSTIDMKGDAMRPVNHKVLFNSIHFLNRMESWFNEPDSKRSEIAAVKLKSYTYETHQTLLVKVAKSILAGHTIPWMDVNDEWKKVKVKNPNLESLKAAKRATHPKNCR